MFDYKSNQIIFNMFAICLFFITLNNVSNPVIGKIGFFSILFILVMASQILYFVFIKKGILDSSKMKFFILYIILILIFSLGIVFNLNSRGIITLGELILIINFFLLYSIIYYEKNRLNYNILFICLTFYLIIYYFGMIKYGVQIGKYSSIYANPNALGLTAFLFAGISLILYNLSQKNIYFLYAILFSFMVYASGTRSSMIAGFFTIIIYFSYKYISKNKRTWTITIITVLLSIIFIIFMYPKIDQFYKYDKWSFVIYKLTGKTLLSGRHIIWKQSINLISKKPLLGYGTGTQLSHVSNIEVSSHNLYIQILLQNGIIGLSVFVFLIISVWNLFYINKDDKLVKLCACLFIGILYQNVFEVTLLQNNMAIAIMQWFIIAIGVSKSLNNRDLA